MIKIIQSKNDTNMISFNSFVFRIDKIKSDHVLWRCNVRNCKARGTSAVDYLNNLLSFSSTGDHNHQASIAYILSQKKELQ
jgi:hypothetical protein